LRFGWASGTRVFTTEAQMKLPFEINEAIAETRARVRFHYPWWLRPFLLEGVGAITIGRRIYVRSGVGEHLHRLLRHELAHVRQINKNGLLRFYILYVVEYLKNVRAGMTSYDAYRSISFERDAYAAEEVLRSVDV
jgi:hypothetical protein